MTTPVSPSRPTQAAAGRLAVTGALTVLVSVAANVVLASLATRLLPIAPEFAPLTAQHIAPVTAIGAIGAVGAFALVARRSRRPRVLFRRIAGAALLLTFVPDLALLVNPGRWPGSSPLAVAVLMLLHVVAAVICIGLLTGSIQDSEGDELVH